MEPRSGRPGDDVQSKQLYIFSGGETKAVVSRKGNRLEKGERRLRTTVHVEPNSVRIMVRTMGRHRQRRGTLVEEKGQGERYEIPGRTHLPIRREVGGAYKGGKQYDKGSKELRQRKDKKQGID